MKVYPDLQPYSLTDCFGVHYHHFTYAEDTGLTDAENHSAGADITGFMECLEADQAQILFRYRHENWGQYAAITKISMNPELATILAVCLIRKY